ncbi:MULTISPECIES: DUF4123 domain-containing protein [Acinetobacter]|uniref:DUF4123 domain-containing protein n=1 Tax=Acinetobacter TaxID=469 RepID=UPI0002AE81B8|nr:MULTISPECIES: DUF4123 domain-containing protein [Acinetobacter]ELW87426.1 PF13503 domain protein [Acinetobacter sp. WC-743]MBJ8425837.1 DUF4123 domain-containing protein [Acinetobacter bereziniae]MBJ8474454.1 DUF4123 domain-containing protein [Acinetobacter bereziniae]
MIITIKDFDQFIENNQKNLGFYCLIDGAQIDHKQITHIEHTFGSCDYLFKDTFEEEAYLFGGILIHLPFIQSLQFENIIKLMNQHNAMIFFKSALSIKQLKNILREKLYLELEDGGIGILRFYDPRILNRLHQILTPEQKKEFMNGIDVYYFKLNDLGYEINNNET